MTGKSFACVVKSINRNRGTPPTGRRFLSCLNKLQHSLHSSHRSDGRFDLSVDNFLLCSTIHPSWFDGSEPRAFESSVCAGHTFRTILIAPSISISTVYEEGEERLTSFFLIDKSSTRVRIGSYFPPSKQLFEGFEEWLCRGLPAHGS